LVALLPHKTKSPARQAVSILSPIINNGPKVKPVGTKVILKGATWVPQTYNNCGPATVSMALQHFGYTVDQETTKRALRTGDDDKNVFMYEVQNYLKSDYGVEYRLLYNGDEQKIKLLLSNGFYVMVEDWLHPGEDIGHFVIIRGYDDEKGVFIFDDSYLGNDTTHPYDAFVNAQWKPYNREYLVMYKPEQEQLAEKIIGDDWNETTMYQHAAVKAQAEIQQNPKDMYAYFNLGSSYFGLKEYDKAAKAYTASQSLGWPQRMLWYEIQPVQTMNELGRYDDAIKLADLGLWANDSFSELHFEKARAYKGLGQRDKAREEAEKTLLYSPNYEPAKELLLSL